MQGKRCQNSYGTYFLLLVVSFLSRLMHDRIKRFEKMQVISKSLEEDWSRSVKHKYQQEEDERHFRRCAGAGSL